MLRAQYLQVTAQPPQERQFSSTSQQNSSQGGMSEFRWSPQQLEAYMNSGEVDEHLRDPLLYEPLRGTLQLSCPGMTYSQHTMQQWLRHQPGAPRNPGTNLPIVDAQVRRNPVVAAELDSLRRAAQRQWLAEGDLQRAWATRWLRQYCRHLEARPLPSLAAQAPDLARPLERRRLQTRLVQVRRRINFFTEINRACAAAIGAHCLGMGIRQRSFWAGATSLMNVAISFAVHAFFIPLPSVSRLLALGNVVGGVIGVNEISRRQHHAPRGMEDSSRWDPVPDLGAVQAFLGAASHGLTLRVERLESQEQLILLQLRALDLIGDVEQLRQNFEAANNPE